MSILEKLKNLVATIEDTNGSEVTVIEEEAIQQQVASLLNEQEKEQAEAEIEQIPDYLECSHEESQEVWLILRDQERIKLFLAEKVLEFDNLKKSVDSSIIENKNELLQKLNSLRLEYGVPGEGYSVQLPSSKEDKVSFQKD